MKEPLVTIGIPTYNRAGGFLRDALTSALNQTYSNIEIIVSDNCSSDGTPELVMSMKDPRLTYHRHDVNIGAPNNFNFCLDQARGEYFLLLHDDDLIDPDFVECCMKAAQYGTEYGTIRTGVRIIDENGRECSKAPNCVKEGPLDEFLRGWFSARTAWYLCSTLFNTRKLRALGGFESRHNLLQDCVAIVKLAATEPRVEVEDIKASFRKHSGEITFAVKVRDWAEDFLYLLEIIRTVAPADAEGLVKEGKRFFAVLSYKRAMAVRGMYSRLAAYYDVWRLFGYRYLPPTLQNLLHILADLLGLRRRIEERHAVP